MYQDPSSKPSKIEQTRRALYDALAKIRNAKKHPKATDELETALEEHLRELGDKIADQVIAIEFAGGVKDLQRQVTERTKERDECQERMRVIDEAYRKSQEALAIAGDELRAVQEVANSYRIEIKSLNQQLGARDETIGRLRKTYGTDEKLQDAQAMIGQQEQLIAGQRKAIADMHNELTHRRVIGKAFMQARQAFVALDEALHEAPQSKAIRAVGDDIVDAEVNF